MLYVLDLIYCTVLTLKGNIDQYFKNNGKTFAFTLAKLLFYHAIKKYDKIIGYLAGLFLSYRLCKTETFCKIHSRKKELCKYRRKNLIDLIQYINIHDFLLVLCKIEKKKNKRYFF